MKVGDYIVCEKTFTGPGRLYLAIVANLTGGVDGRPLVRRLINSTDDAPQVELYQEVRAAGSVMPCDRAIPQEIGDAAWAAAQLGASTETVREILRRGWPCA
jgi:hypothetical protein